MSGIGTGNEFHCTLKVSKQHAERDPKKFVLSFNNAPDMEDLNVSRLMDDVKAVIVEGEDPENVIKTFPLREAITFQIIDGAKVLRRYWEGVTQLDEGTSNVRVTATDRSSGQKFEMKYEIFVPSAA